jgi:UDP-2,3-diacylglucosamine hydrolase
MSELRETIYLASDFHLGIPNEGVSREREFAIVSWLDQIKPTAKEIFLVGDLFDFWFEYKHVVPRGHVRFLGKLAEIVDVGIPVHVFTGNHDMWMFDYLPRELGVTLHRDPVVREFQGKKYYIGHGDGLGPGDYGYKLIKGFFNNRVCQWLFARIHPNFGIGMANFWSRKSRNAGEARFESPEKEWLYAYCLEILREQPDMDCFIFGHRHLPLDLSVGEQSRYINLGDWIEFRTYVAIEDGRAELKTFCPS